MICTYIPGLHPGFRISRLPLFPSARTRYPDLHTQRTYRPRYALTTPRFTRLSLVLPQREHTRQSSCPRRVLDRVRNMPSPGRPRQRGGRGRGAVYNLACDKFAGISACTLPLDSLHFRRDGEAHIHTSVPRGCGRVEMRWYAPSHVKPPRSRQYRREIAGCGTYSAREFTSVCAPKHGTLQRRRRGGEPRPVLCAMAEVAGACVQVYIYICVSPWVLDDAHTEPAGLVVVIAACKGLGKLSIPRVHICARFGADGRLCLGDDGGRSGGEERRRRRRSGQHGRPRCQKARIPRQAPADGGFGLHDKGRALARPDGLQTRTEVGSSCT